MMKVKLARLPRISMTMGKFPRKQGRKCCLVLLPLVAMMVSTETFAADNAAPQEATPQPDRRPISWVNPKLPAGPGLTHYVLDSKALGHEVGYVVYLPPSYAASGTKRYPVVVFLHGSGGTESADSAGFSSHVAQAAQAGLMPESIVVFPNGGRSGYRGEVETMITEELIPLIDRTYRTIPTTSSRAVAGFSMGGAGAVWLATKYPNLFGVASSWGGGLGRNEAEILANVETNAATLKKNDFGVLLINGEKDRPDAYLPLAAKLKETGIPYKVEMLPNTPHNLGLYYQLSGMRTLHFLGQKLKAQPNS